MKNNTKKKDKELLQIEDLRMRLEEAEETLRAIRKGEVDALVVSGPPGDRVYTLKGAEQPYRVFVETMNEGAVTLSHDGTILYCNDRFADMVETPYEKVVGHRIHQFIASPDVFESAFERGKRGLEKVEVLLKRKNKEPLPVYLSLNPLLEDEGPGICVVLTDLEALKKSEAQLRYLASKLLDAQEEERKRISHEIHDALGSSLGGIKFMAEKLLEQIGKNDILEDMIRSIRQTSEEARRIQSALHPPLLDDLGILATINWFSREFQKTYSGIRIENQINLEETDIPAPGKMAIYRIAQEALSNIARHSKANFVRFCLQKTDRIELLIRDNGQGFHLDQEDSLDRSKRGIGLSSMRERAELSGGTFEIESTVGKGTAIRVVWPI